MKIMVMNVNNNGKLLTDFWQTIDISLYFLFKYVVRCIKNVVAYPGIMRFNITFL